MSKPFLRWVGGKTQLLPDLNRLAPTRYNTYYEPFIGGGAFFYSLKPGKAVINDFNPHLSDLYLDLRDNIDELIAEIRIIETAYLPLNDEGRKALYYEYRSIYNSLESCMLKSALFLFLNRTCFNGVYRENPQGDFNVPFGKKKLTSLYDEETLKNASKALQNVKILNGSYEQALLDARYGDFVYLDPPYVPLTPTASFTGYTGNGFGMNEQTELRNIYRELSEKGCSVMLSNSNTELVRDLYTGFNFHEVFANRAVNCKAQGRGKIKELVITNY